MTNCKAATSAGKPCKSARRKNSDFCFFHDPHSSESRQEAQSKGGRRGALVQVIPNPSRDFMLDRPDGIVELLQYAVNCVVRGELDPRTANTLGYLADCALRAYNIGKLSARLADLEKLQNAESALPPYAGDCFVSRFEEEGPEPSVNPEVVQE